MKFIGNWEQLKLMIKLKLPSKIPCRFFGIYFLTIFKNNTRRKLSEKLPYIDSKRIGIWGWSYGGYASAWALARDNSSVFACAASVAPVTDWIYYGKSLSYKSLQF